MPERLERVLADLEQFSSIGRNAEGGIDRVCLEAPDLEARSQFMALIQACGGKVQVDGAANILGTFSGRSDLPPIWIGSHLDTVRNGGAYDGTLGVLAALEVVRSLREDGIVLHHPLTVVSFTGEEPNHFGFSTLGSRLLTGRLDPARVWEARSPSGRQLIDALRQAGGDPERLDRMRVRPGEVAAYIELHIEQGLRLARRGLPVAVVADVVGIYRTAYSWRGEANHAGTTEIADRHDALLGAAQFVLSVEGLCRAAAVNGRPVVGTVGQLDVAPNAVNVVPGVVDLTVELRSNDEQELNDLTAAVENGAAPIARERGLRVHGRPVLRQAPVRFDERVRAVLADACEMVIGRTELLTSMGGHDAVHLSTVAPTGMLFVRTPNGKSHCPEEYCQPEDIDVALRVFRRAVIVLDGVLEAP